MSTSSLAGIVIPAAGGAVAMIIMIAGGQIVGLTSMLVPFTTSIVLVMSVPESPLASARNVIGGHLVSAAAGYAVLWTLGDNVWFSALAVGLAIAGMLASRTLHPPAGINALIVVTQNMSWQFFFSPVAAGALILVAFARGWRYAAQRAVGKVQDGSD